MNSRKEIAQAKRQLESVERRLSDVRFLRERLARTLNSPEAAAMLPSLQSALNKLAAAQPSLEAQYDHCFDCLRALSLAASLAPSPQRRSLDSRRRIRDKASCR